MTLILTPLTKEFELLSQAFTELGWTAQIVKKGFLTGILYKEQAVYLFVGGHGKIQFAIQTGYLIERIEGLKKILCVGAAGSLTKSVKPGDIIVATQTIEHDFKLKFIQKPLPSFPGDTDLLKKSLSLKKDHIHLGAIASGDEDVVDEVCADQIFQKTQSLCVAWEGAGGARAAQFYNLPFLEVRAVSDSANLDAKNDFLKHLKKALTVTAYFLAELLKEDV